MYAPMLVILWLVHLRILKPIVSPHYAGALRRHSSPSLLPKSPGLHPSSGAAGKMAMKGTLHRSSPNVYI